MESLLEVRGPGNTFIIVETFAKHKKLATSEVQVTRNLVILVMDRIDFSHLTNKNVP